MTVNEGIATSGTIGAGFAWAAGDLGAGAFWVGLVAGGCGGCGGCVAGEGLRRRASATPAEKEAASPIAVAVVLLILSVTGRNWEYLFDEALHYYQCFSSIVMRRMLL